MFNWLKRIIAPPIFVDDEDKTRIATQLNLILWTFAVIVVAVGIDVPFLFRTQATVIIAVLGGLLLLTLGMLLLMHRGWVRLAGGLFSLGMWVLYALLIVGSGGMTSPVNLTWIVVVIMAGLLSSRRVALGYVGLSAVAGLGILYLEINGLLPPQFITFSPVGGWVLMTAHLGITIMLLYLAIRSMDEALGHARRTTAELEQQRGQLETLVEERTRDLAQRSNYLEATIAVAHEAASTLDQPKLLSQVTQLISERFDCYHTGVFLLDPSKEWAVLQAVSSEGGQKMLARGYRVRVGGPGVVSYVVDRGVPYMAQDVAADVVHLENPDLPETRSELAFPLQARGEIIGALDMQSTQVHAFGREEVAVFGVLADEVALAIDNARLFEQTQAAVEAERRAVGELTGQAWQLLRTRAGTLSFLRNRQGLVEETTRQVQSVDRARLDQNQPHKLDVPIKVRDQVIGVIQASKPAQVGPWTREQVALVETLTEQLGVALESARLHQDTQRRAARDRLIGEVTARMRESLEMETLLRTAASEMRQALGLDDLVVRLTAQETDGDPARDVALGQVQEGTNDANLD
jgi:GAF domain-containing protein